MLVYRCECGSFGERTKCFSRVLLSGPSNEKHFFCISRASLCRCYLETIRFETPLYIMLVEDLNGQSEVAAAFY